MVCCMYYTDVFVGTNNDINNLKKALEAELEGSGKPVDLTQLKDLASGLGFLAGLPACLCKTKKSVKEGLKKIYEELKTSLISCDNFNISKLNCDLCSKNLYPCKCCVIQSIKAVKECPCLKGKKTPCHCNGQKVSCSKVLAGLEACLHLQCLQSDMNEICQCSGSECCKGGQCNGNSGGPCDFCEKLQTQPTTGLGLSPPNPIRLAKRLDKFFGSSPGPKNGCKCQCGSGSPPNKSCCCLACETGKCSQACSCNNSGCSCDKSPSDCPRKVFCIAIKDIKIAAESKERTCCDGGKKCHCEVAGSGSNCNSGNCCIEKVGNSTYKHSLKCLLRRVVKFFNGLSLDPSSSNSNRSRICCELVCVVKTCYFIKDFYNKKDKEECSKCKKGGKGGSCPSNGKCCSGPTPNCGSSSGGTFCQKCDECQQICYAKEFFNELQTLRFAGPCGQDLWRTLDAFLQGCVFRVAGFDKYDIIKKIKAAQNSCSACQNASKSGKSSSSCDCCSSGSCLACTSLLKDPSLKSLFNPEYVSSYDSSAKWDSLCKSGSKCSGCTSSCSCSHSGSCPDKGCCEKCPKRLCAKIFLGMLPCMYWGLKIVFDRCKYGSGFAGWHDISVSNDIPKNDLTKFLFAWGFQTIESSGSSTIHMNPSLQAMVLPVLLENLFTPESSGNFDKIYKEVSEKYFSKHVSDPSKSQDPLTVREMLLWLYGLRFQKHFSDLVSHCKDLCLPFGNSFHPDAFCYYIHTCSFILPVAIISFIETSESAQKAFSSSSEFSKFLYPSDPSELFEAFCEYVRKIFVALNFLCIQCKNSYYQAGWKFCYYGGSCKKALGNSSSSNSLSSATSSSDCSCPNSKTYLCTGKPYGTPDAHDHCMNGNQCIGPGPCNGSIKAHTSNQCKDPCPHPLQLFLTHGSESDSKSQDYPFGLSGITPMGFSQQKLSSTPVKGEKLYHDIYGFCKDGFYPLTRLVQFILCVSQRPPETLGELFAFFKQFVSQLNSKDFKDHFVQWIEGEPGTYSGEDLKTALEKLYGSHSGDHSPANLFSLSSCHVPTSISTCGKYLHALTEEAYNIFIDKFADTYLSWICYRAGNFYSEFKAFYEEAEEKFSCCLTSCTKIVECPCALPFIYSHGFTFHSPSGLNCVDAQGTKHQNNEGKEKHSGGDGAPGCTRKTCKNFIDQLGLVVGPKSTLLSLIAEIDNFLWSIRLPFFFGFLYVWFFVLSYFFYVILIKLDTFHTGSHLHLPRSFKILPSTLFSDASSKLKDLSYFTL
ncbi:variant erythrocyte surface antigen-1 family protein [Babesia divergens]|uniref:Variant erythrocyte surface antigen-1 family protein n=1 Tax=Babesia divergens TaxID=32595 RepID=A0AAD9G5G2_BABDI|nr:variant erythrocyte surface antigen-1 family protein [Babesia divergens]